jgi:hypothetical protein
MDLSNAVWRKASRSTVQNDNCVEVAAVTDVFAVRDSKDPDGPKVVLSRGEFRSLAKVLKDV